MKTTPFDYSNHPVAIRYIFEGGNPTGFKILYILACCQKGLYNIQQIANMCHISKGGASTELRRLLEKGYLYMSENKYYLSQARVQDSEQSDEKVQDPEQKIQDLEQKVQDSELHSSYSNIVNNNIKNFFVEEKKQEKKVIEEVKRDSKIQEVLDKALKPLDASIEQDNRYTLLSRRPMVKYPLIWLSERDLEQAIETCQAKGISLKAVLDITQSWCEQQLLEGKPEKYINAVSAIQGWAMERVLSIELAEVKIDNQLNFMKGKGK